MSSRTFNIQFPVYQIDFSAVAAGKRVAATKRRIRWRFGFPNLKALEEGRTGTECRGEEHEIVIVWSVTSGKRQIIMDGREIHFSSNRVGVIDFSWNAKGNHVFKTICHATPPLSPQPGFRQYDLFIDGQTFFRMPKVFELGVRGVSAQDNRIPGQYNSYNEEQGYNNNPRSAYGGYPSSSEPSIRPPQSSSEEDAELQRAIQASLADAKNHLGENPSSAPDVLSSTTPAPATADLLDFDGPAVSSGYNSVPPPAITADPSLNAYDGGFGGTYNAPPSSQSYLALPSSQPISTSQPYGAPPPQPPQQQFAALPPSQSSGMPYGSPSAPPPPPQQQYPALPPSQPVAAVPYGAPPPQQYQWPAQQQPVQQNQYAPGYGSATDDPFAPKPPSLRDVSTDILKAYGGASTPGGAVSMNGNHMGGYGSPPPAAPGGGYYQPGQPYGVVPNGSNPTNNGGYYNDTNGTTAGVTLSMNKLTMTETLVVAEEKPSNPFEAAMKKLVNIDHIDEPAEEQYKLTMKQQEDERLKKLKNKSAPLPPAAARVVGSGATLREISTVKPPTKKELVMKPPPHLFQGDAAMAGALVEYGAPPPPLQPRGFGVVHMQGQYAAQPPPPQQHYGYGYR